MLTDLDDYPIHQFAEPMRSVGTSVVEALERLRVRSAS
jgi:hypothetical protein